MKSLLILVVLAVLAITNEAAVIKDEDIETRELSQRNLNLGTISNTDWLLDSDVFSRSGQPNTILRRDITFRGNMVINAIRARELISQGASATILSGGLGRNFVTIRLESAPERGYSFQIRIYGRFL